MDEYEDVRRLDANIKNRKEVKSDPKINPQLIKDYKERERQQRIDARKQMRLERKSRMMEKRQRLLRKRREQLEEERLKAEIRKLKSETSLSGKISRMQKKMREKQRKSGSKTVHKKKPQPKYVIKGGVAYPVASKSTPKKRKPKKKKNEWTL